MKETSNSTRKNRVTIHDIAKEVGLHFTTVARALKESGRVSKESTERVKAAAQRLGYSADPLVAALCEYRSGLKSPRYKGNIGWINGFGTIDYFDKLGHGFYSTCYKGAKARCEELGYKLETVWIGEPGINANRASQIIHSRGMAGLLVAPMPPEIHELDLLWDKFSAVRIGYSLAHSDLPNVIGDHFGNMGLLLNRLYELGFRRVGLACHRWIDNRVRNQWSGAFLTYGGQGSPDLQKSLFIKDDLYEQRDVFKEWLLRERPEVLITVGPDDCRRAVKDIGLRVPEDVHMVSLSADNDETGFYAGIDQEGEVVGMVAVDQVVGIIRRAEAGLESFPKSTMISGKWRDGRSIDPALLESRSASPSGG